MNKALLGLAALLLMDVAFADNYTRPYTRRDGTTVPGHYSSEPNSVRHDNYSGRGNTNPYTGEQGSARHEFTTPPAYNTGRDHSNSYSQPSSNPYGNPYTNPYESRPARNRNGF
jgi:hypothetical protein